jgi:hypothetical protein
VARDPQLQKFVDGENVKITEDKYRPLIVKGSTCQMI